MFSASDPIRGGSEWRLPWQVSMWVARSFMSYCRFSRRGLFAVTRAHVQQAGTLARWQRFGL
jgi:hypothetical protein